MSPSSNQKIMHRERWNLFLRIDHLLNVPMNILAFVWLILTVIELTNGISQDVSRIVTIIWIIFWLHFIIEFLIAPTKITFIKHNWLTALSLILPALRIFKTLRFFRYIPRAPNLIRILGSVNRSMNALSRTLGKRGFKYIFSLTIIIIFAGAAGIMVFEKGYTNFFNNYGAALWWTSMMITSMGTDYFPKSAEGRILGLLLATYGFAIFGYVTAIVATFFIDKDHPNSDIKVLQKKVSELQETLDSLKKK